jgi:hypothetical protein
VTTYPVVIGVSLRQASDARCSTFDSTAPFGFDKAGSEREDSNDGDMTSNSINAKAGRGMAGS